MDSCPPLIALMRARNQFEPDTLQRQCRLTLAEFDGMMLTPECAAPPETGVQRAAL